MISSPTNRPPVFELGYWVLIRAKRPKTQTQTQVNSFWLAASRDENPECLHVDRDDQL